jgi:flagellar hook-length control protein FliK
VKAEAPQAPVSQISKNKKTPGTSHSAALGRGPAKGSAFFQQLMSARASKMTGAGKADGALLVLQAEGLKGELSLSALLKALRAGAQNQKLPGLIPGAAEAADAVTEKDKLDAARKAARAKSAALGIEVQQAAARADGAQRPAVSLKEQKKESAEPSKAQAVEPRPTGSRAEPLIRIVDLRRAEKPHPASEAVLSRTADQASSDKDQATPVTLRLGASREPFAETLSKPAPATGTSGQTPLERLREMAGSELVRASTLVLKDGGGEIKLVLKPESLGSVRIRMNLVDNAIEGRIIVDSSAVKHVFDGSVDALRRALTAEGFQMGSLQVSVGGQDAGDNAREQREQAPSAVRRITAQGFERNIPGVENVSLGDLFVNLFV